MLNYSEALRKHGTKLWLANLLGSLVAGVAAVIVLIFFAILFMIIAGTTIAGMLPATTSLDTMNDAEFAQFAMSLTSSPAFWTALSFLGIFLIIAFVFFLFIAAFQQAGAVSVVIEAIKEDQVDIGTYFSKGLKYTGKMFLVSLLSSLTYLIPGLVAVLALLSFSEGSGVGIALGVLLVLIAIVLAVIIALAFLHAPYILISENAEVLKSLKKSVYLFRKAFDRVFGSGFFAFLISAVTSFVIFIVFFILALCLHTGGNQATTVGSVVLELFRIVTELVVNPLVIVLITLLLTDRYFRYLRPLIAAQSEEGDSNSGQNVTPSFHIKGSDSETPRSEKPFHWDDPTDPASNPPLDHDPNKEE